MQPSDKPVIKVLSGMALNTDTDTATLQLPVSAALLGVSLLVPPAPVSVVPTGSRRGSSSGGIISSLLNPAQSRKSQPRKSFIAYALEGQQPQFKEDTAISPNPVGRNSLLVPQVSTFQHNLLSAENNEEINLKNSRRNSAVGKPTENQKSQGPILQQLLGDKLPASNMQRRQSLLQKIKKATPELNTLLDTSSKPLQIINEKTKPTVAPSQEFIPGQDGRGTENLHMRKKSPLPQQYKEGAEKMKKEGVKKVVGANKLTSHIPLGEKVKSEGSNASTDLPNEDTRFISNSKLTPGGGAGQNSKNTDSSNASTQLGFYRQESPKKQDPDLKGIKSSNKVNLKNQGKKVSEQLTPFENDGEEDFLNANLSKSEKVTPFNGNTMQGTAHNQAFNGFRSEGSQLLDSPSKKNNSNKVYPMPLSNSQPPTSPPLASNQSQNLMPQFALMRTNMPNFQQMENQVLLKSVNTIKIGTMASMRRNTIIMNNTAAPNFEPPRLSFNQANMNIPKQDKKDNEDSDFEEDSLDDDSDDASFSSHDINATNPFSSSESDDSDNDDEEGSFKRKYIDQQHQEDSFAKHQKTKKHPMDEVSAAKQFIMKSNTRRKLLDDSSDASSNSSRNDKKGGDIAGKQETLPRKTYTLNPNQDGWRMALGSVIGGANAAPESVSGETPGFNNSGKESSRSNLQGFLSQAFTQFTRGNRNEEDAAITVGQFTTTTGNLETKRPMLDGNDNESDTNSQRNNQPKKQAEQIKRSNDIVKENTLRKQKEEALYDDYYASLSQKEGYRLRDIYPEVQNKFVILPDDPKKTKWEIVISLILIFTAVTTPYRIAFVDKDSTLWVVVNYFIDGMFLIDIVLCFFSGFEDENEELVHDRKIIAREYCASWFFIDVISIIPLSEFLETSDFASLARIARLPKLYRLIRMFKLMRLLKVIKERNTISKYLNEVLKLSVAVERLVFFCFMFMILVHITSCFWVILSSFEDTDDNLIMRNHFYNLDSDELYVACFYYTTVIVTTIGYGDITVRTPYEQLFCLILLIIGVVGFSFAIGSLSSVLSSLDAKAGKLKEKLSMLEDIRREYKIPYDLYRRLRLALNYDHHSKNAEEYMVFLNELPAALKVELSVVMHSELVKSIQFFRHKPPHFIAYVAPLLKPVKLEKDQYIYKENDPIDEIYFLVSGQAGYALPDYDNSVYLLVDTGYYFGEIDFIVLDESGENTGKRCFSVRSVIESDLLILSKNHLLDLDMEFEDVISQIFLNAMNRLKRTQWLKKKSIKFYDRIKRQKAKEEQRNAVSNAQGDKSKQQTLENPSTDHPVVRKSFSFADGGGEFLESLNKRLIAQKDKDKNLLGGAVAPAGGIHEDMMKNLDEGDFDKLINEQSSRSSMIDSNSFRSDKESTLRQNSHHHINNTGSAQHQDSFAKAQDTPVVYTKQGITFQRQDSSNSSSNLSKRAGMQTLQKKLTMGIHTSSMSVVDEHKEYDNNSRYDEKQYQSVLTPHDNDSQHKTPSYMQQNKHQLGQIENFSFDEEEKISNGEDSPRGSFHLTNKVGTPIHNPSANGSHTKVPSGFGSHHKQPKQNSPMMSGAPFESHGEESCDNEEGGLRWNQLKQDLTKKAIKGRPTQKIMSSTEALGQFQVKILNQVGVKVNGKHA